MAWKVYVSGRTGSSPPWFDDWSALIFDVLFSCWLAQGKVEHNYYRATYIKRGLGDDIDDRRIAC